MRKSVLGNFQVEAGADGYLRMVFPILPKEITDPGKTKGLQSACATGIQDLCHEVAAGSHHIFGCAGQFRDADLDRQTEVDKRGNIAKITEAAKPGPMRRPSDASAIS